MLSHANGALHLLPPPTEGKDSCAYGLPALERATEIHHLHLIEFHIRLMKICGALSATCMRLLPR